MLSLWSPTAFAPSEVSPGCPPAAQRSPTLSFLFSNACQETCYSALNMWLARGQALAANRLTNYLARVMASLSMSTADISSLPHRLQRSLRARLDLGMAGGCPGRVFLSLLCPFSVCSHFPTYSLPSSSLFISNSFVLTSRPPSPQFIVPVYTQIYPVS